MAANITGLGKGLDALIRERRDSVNVTGLRTLPLEDLVPNPRQPRRQFSAKSMDELADSIRSQGLLQPLLVRPAGTAQPGKYEIVSGERRWRACKMVGLEEVPVYVRVLSEQDTLASALIENLQREDLNPLEEATALQILKDEFGLSQDELAGKIGKSRPYIANSLRLLTLPETVRSCLADGRLSPGHARALLSVPEAGAQEKLKDLILDRRLSVREAEGLAALWKEKGGLDQARERDPVREEGEKTAALHPEQGSTAGAAAPQAQNAEGEIGKKNRSAVLLDLQTRIGACLRMPVRVTGREDRGRVSFTYNSKEELEEFIDKLQSLGETAPAAAGGAGKAKRHFVAL
ncbi:MAG: ParB/RepB/Spo0J family partition protein [Desulfovibrio sp.]|jgi:ParB family chromosome partitioning protein|nr:ParB/RepB/Spo0J family partition protein [Desulfovibrio sp.]